ncbi:uncharacterized protein LOC144422026 [Styela clava]
MKSLVLILGLVLLAVSFGDGYYHRRRYHHSYHAHHHYAQYNRFSRSLTSLYRIGRGLRVTGNRLIGLYRLYRRMLINMHHYGYHGDEDDLSLLDEDTSSFEKDEMNMPEQLADNAEDKDDGQAEDDISMTE